MAEDPVGLGPRIRRAREVLGLSQQELAARARLSVPVLNRLETGQRANPGLEILRTLAYALGVTLDYLGEMETFRQGEAREETPSERCLTGRQGCRARTPLLVSVTP
jgi:transcriptional regulator with XRE-family HTH domain